MPSFEGRRSLDHTVAALGISHTLKDLANYKKFTTLTGLSNSTS